MGKFKILMLCFLVASIYSFNCQAINTKPLIIECFQELKHEFFQNLGHRCELFAKLNQARLKKNKDQTYHDLNTINSKPNGKREHVFGVDPIQFFLLYTLVSTNKIYAFYSKGT